ncbi:hypothetical protein CPB84DRAFT_1768598 [Gymnopilus junonius]|uniref:Uncharacterized protein n=1 Tax=Gymnopilus junonius TaxID=109634 RepID=A0A9P5TSG7_GYMJU|nr:hypothetical protein CPB84DRAFT_1768598 [Gymnopilus junonius]
MDYWAKEIRKFEPDLKVYCFKTGKSEFRADDDVVFITYSQLQSQYKEESTSPFFQRTWYRVICGISVTIPTFFKESALTKVKVFKSK